MKTKNTLLRTGGKGTLIIKWQRAASHNEVEGRVCASEGLGNPAARFPSSDESVACFLLAFTVKWVGTVINRAGETIH